MARADLKYPSLPLPHCRPHDVAVTEANTAAFVNFNERTPHLQRERSGAFFSGPPSC